MMWFFAILIVLTLGGVALVAAGRGEPLAEVYDDRPDVVLPTDGPVSAAALRRVRFPLAFRGYRMAEVDALLDRVAAQLEERGAPADAPEEEPQPENGADPLTVDESRGEDPPE